MAAGDVSGDLAWWRAHRNASDVDPAAMRPVLERLKAWKAEHDQGRAGQPAGFLQMVWDAILADEHHAVEEAIRELEAALAGA